MLVEHVQRKIDAAPLCVFFYIAKDIRQLKSDPCLFGKLLGDFRSQSLFGEIRADGASVFSSNEPSN